MKLAAALSTSRALVAALAIVWWTGSHGVEATAVELPEECQELAFPVIPKSPTPPTVKPSATPTLSPTTATPTLSPTTATPTGEGEMAPSETPSESPVTDTPTKSPTSKPTDFPTSGPTDSPTEKPSFGPTKSPSNPPTKNPTDFPTKDPTKSPTTNSPTQNPSKAPVAPVAAPVTGSGVSSGGTPAPSAGSPCVETFYDFGIDEQGWSRDTSVSGSDQDAHYVKTTQNSYKSYVGQNSLRIRDDSTESWIASPVHDIAGMSKATIVFDFCQANLDANDNDHFALEVKEDDGGWVEAAVYKNVDDFADANQCYEDFSHEIDITGIETIEFRFRGKMTANNDFIYFKNVKVTICSPTCVSVSDDDFSGGFGSWSNVNSSPLSSGGNGYIKLDEANDAIKKYNIPIFDEPMTAKEGVVKISYSYWATSVGTDKSRCVELLMKREVDHDTGYTKFHEECVGVDFQGGTNLGTSVTNKVVKEVVLKINPDNFSKLHLQFKKPFSNGNFYIDDIKVEICGTFPHYFWLVDSTSVRPPNSVCLSLLYRTCCAGCSSSRMSILPHGLCWLDPW